MAVQRAGRTQTDYDCSPEGHEACSNPGQTVCSENIHAHECTTLHELFAPRF